MTQDEQKVANLNKLKLIIGSVLFVFTVVMMALYEVSPFILGVPAFLLGMNPRDFIIKEPK